MATELDFLDMKRLDVDVKNAVYKQQSTRYNSKVKLRVVQVRDMVLRRVTGLLPGYLTQHGRAHTGYT